MDIIIKKLVNPSINKKNEEEIHTFQKFFEQINIDQIENIIKETITTSEGPQIVKNIFQGLSMNASSQKKRIHVRLVKTQWKDLLPKILTLLGQKEEIDHYGSDISGENYKKQVIVALCQAKWHSEILPSLAAMFIHIPMIEEEHSKIVSKLCSGLEKLEPNAVPPLVHQLLRLTRNQGTVTLLLALKKYYNERIYKLNDSIGMLDDISHGSSRDEIEDVEVCKNEIIESERMVLYHIRVMEKSCSGWAELIKVAKSCTSAPQVILNPFFLAILLIVSNVPSYQLEIMTLLKNTIKNISLEEEKLEESEWMRKLLSTKCDVDTVLIKLIRSKACEEEGVIDGLLSLSITLLMPLPFKYSEFVVKRVARYGRLIAVNLAVKHVIVTGTVLNAIVKNIIVNPHCMQYSECLCELCDSCPMLVNDYPDVIKRLLEMLPLLPETAAFRVTAALISLIRISQKLRDNLIMTLRQSLFIHDPSTRRMVVSGFLQLLKRLKIKGIANSLSQNSFQAYTCPSVFTQTCLEIHSQASNPVNSGNNEGICLEVINVLKSCFTQQLPVKITLYSALNRALIRNPDLCIPTADIFLEHLGDYYEVDEDVVPPLNFHKAIVIQQSEVVVTEPLGHLLFVVQQIIVTSERINCDVDDENHHANSTKLHKLMESLVDRFTKCQNKHLDLDEEFDGSPEAKWREERLRQCLIVYQALMAYLLSIWDETKTVEDVEKLLSLFRTHSSFVEFAKNKKDEGDKKKAGSKDTTIIPGKKCSFSFPETVLDFEAIIRILTLLMGEVDWCLEDVAAVLKNKKCFRRYAFQCALEVLLKTKSQLNTYKPKSLFGNLKILGKLIVDKCMKCFDEAIQFDANSSITMVEIFNEILKIIFSKFNKHLSSFLAEICDVVESEGLNTQLNVIADIYLNILNKILDGSAEDDGDDDPKFKRLLTVLVNGLETISLELPIEGTCISKVTKWLTDLAQTRNITVLPVVKTLVSLLLKLHTRCNSNSPLCDNLALQLCELFRSINDVEIERSPINFELVNATTKATIFSLLCSNLNERLDAVDWVIVRMKSEADMIKYAYATPTSPNSRKGRLKYKEKDVVIELGLVVSASQWMCTAAVPKSCAESVCKLLYHVYLTLTTFTKYFFTRSSPVYQEARFGKLVKLAASHLSTQLADFLLHIETLDNDEERVKKNVSAKAIRHAKKQSVYIPKLVAQLEIFTRHVTQLSVKFKDTTLVSEMKLTTIRDFRLNAKKVEEVMKRTHESSTDEESEDLNTTSSSVPPMSQNNKTGSQSSVKNSQKRKKTQL
uniref:Fanconi anemia group I protein n=1 Tax=Rhodnius prolixus TaxID=13249 RepID=T1HAE3_RHOPR